jgi:branched-chain amino acid aminotransferase
MNECYGKYFVLNGELVPQENFDSSLVYEGESVYEVIRIVNGIPVFFNDHIARLESGVRFRQKDMLGDLNVLISDFSLLLKSDNKQNINIKLVFNYSGGKNSRIVYFIEPLYPSDEQYANGVKGILYFAERKNPESKLINHRLRSDIYHRLILENAYEALLVNRCNRITEGSRSNIFFIRDNTLFTAPSQNVLSGITRMHLIEICAENDIRVVYECIDAASLQLYESVFMSGTSPVVLPFNMIGSTAFNTGHWLIPLLRKLYWEKAETSMDIFAGRI